MNGGGSQCCYDERGYLIYSGDNHYGGTPARHHPDGVVPTVTTKFVPTLSHWTWDVTAFYWCCEWQMTDTDCYGKYTALRLTEDCRNYKPAGQGKVLVFNYELADPGEINVVKVFYYKPADQSEVSIGVQI